MVIAVHNVSKPALGRRALWVTLLLLLLAMALAFQMSITRSRISPVDWGISFTAPHGFVRSIASRPSRIIPFVSASTSGPKVTIILWQLGDLGESDPTKIYAMIFKQLESSPQKAVLSDQRTRLTRKMFGPLEGTEQINPRGTSMVRSAIFNRREIYAISLTVAGGAPINKKLYDIFDNLCLSVESR